MDTSAALIETEKILIESLTEKSFEKSGETLDILTITPLTGDASSRKYFRLFGNKKSYVVCLQKPIEETEDSFTDLQNIYKDEGIRVPHIWDKDLNKGFLLEEDLGDQTLLKYLSKLESPKKEYEAFVKAMDILINIQKINIEKYKNHSFTKLSFDFEKLYYEVNFTKENLINGLFNQELNENQNKVLVDSFTEICKKLSSKKMCLTHRDFHSRNIMVSEDDFVVIDFQDSRLGIPQYDLVSILEDCYYKISSQNREKLKKYYFNNGLQNLVDDQTSYEEFIYYYDLMTIQRVFKALGSFAYIYRLRKDIRYLKYIGYAFEKLREILFRYKEFNDLRVVLSEIYYEY